MSPRELSTLQADGPHHCPPEQSSLPCRASKPPSAAKYLSYVTLAAPCLPLIYMEPEVIWCLCGVDLAPQAPGKHLLCPQISQVWWSNCCLFLNIHICIPLIHLLVSKPRRRVTFPNISFYPGLEMCIAPLNRISVPPLVVQVQLWLQEKCHSKPTALTPRGAFCGEDLWFSISTCPFHALRLAGQIPCSWAFRTVGQSFPSTFSSAPRRGGIQAGLAEVGSAPPP